MRLDVTAYAALCAELASASEPRDDTLARHGLDEEQWEALDSHWQQALSDGMDVENDGVPAVLSDFANAYGRAQRELATPITLEQFAEVTRLLSASGDIGTALARVGITLADYVRGSEMWSGRMATDPELERQFERALAGHR